MKPSEFAGEVRREIGKAIVGQDQTVTEMLVCCLSGGHALLEGVPGVAKTLMAKCLALSMGVRFKRVQFTPDLMPSDVTGTSIWDPAASQFRVSLGPIFTDILLADEINRTPPKTQSALLEGMEERTVTIDGDTHALPPAFFVLATENPVEYEGTYPLPEAQLDRFMMKILVDYPSEQEEIAVLRRAHEGLDPHDNATIGIRQVCDPAGVEEVRQQCRAVTVQDAVLGYVAGLVRATRQSGLIALGASPRAGVALLTAAKTFAALDDRDYLLPDDVKQMAPAVLRHRLILKPEALIDGLSVDAVVDQALSEVPAPR